MDDSESSSSDSDSQAEEHDLNECLAGVPLDYIDPTVDEVTTYLYI